MNIKKYENNCRVFVRKNTGASFRGATAGGQLVYSTCKCTAVRQVYRHRMRRICKKRAQDYRQRTVHHPGTSGVTAVSSESCCKIPVTQLLLYFCWGRSTIKNRNSLGCEYESDTLYRYLGKKKRLYIPV